MTTALDELRMRHKEWSGWLDVVALTLDECADAQRYLSAQPVNAAAAPSAPSVVAALAPRFDIEHMTEWLRLVSRHAGASKLPGMAGFAGLDFSQGDAPELFDAELDADYERLAAFAERIGVDIDALRAVANLFVMPPMHACRQTQAARVAVSRWGEGYCPCCGAWPAYAEICGVERERRLCCGRCGTSWAHDVLACVYCATRDHTLLSTLVVEAAGAQQQRGIEACNRCKGYLKQFRHLLPSAALEMLIRDLGSIELDIAASQRSYVRPRGVGRAGGILSNS